MHPDQRVCLNCAYRKIGRHVLACPHCFPAAMVSESAWRQGLLDGTFSTPIPPVRSDQPEFQEESPPPPPPPPPPALPLAASAGREDLQLCLWRAVR